MTVARENRLAPLHVFRFEVEFNEDPFQPDSTQDQDPNGSGGGDRSERSIPLCSGAFAECTGLEATMEPKVIKEGGRNYGAAQRSGPVTFATVVLRRGMTETRDLWKWFEFVTSESKYAYRLAATITMKNLANEPVLRWKLDKVFPTKFKAADLNAKGSEIAIEELHLAHEGLRVLPVGSEQRAERTPA